MRRILRENALSLVLGALFALALAGQAVTGLRTYNADQQAHGEPTVSLAGYLTSGHFAESVFENWESEFLQMALLVVLTAMLRQKGAAESKKLDGPEPVDADPRCARLTADRPWPVRRGGLALAIYEQSLSIALALLFVASLALHAAGGAREYSAEQLAHGEPAVSVLAYLGTARFWFESFQNWQSEFLAVAALMLLSIVLRQRGSPQSKPVAAPHAQTGQDEEPEEAEETRPPRRRPAGSATRDRREGERRRQRA